MKDKFMRWAVSSLDTFVSAFLAAVIFQVDKISEAVLNGGAIPTRAMIYSILFACLATGLRAVFKKTRESRKNSYYNRNKK